MNVAPELDLDQAVFEVADLFRAVAARNVRWSKTSVPVADLMLQYNLAREDAMALRDLAFELVTPRPVLIAPQRQGRGADRAPRAGKSGYHSRKLVVRAAWLDNPHITVREVCDLVEIHPSTARLYLTELRTSHL